MAKQIKSSDIFEEDLFKELKKQVDEAGVKLDGLSTKLTSVGGALKKELEGLKMGDLDSINKILSKTKEVENSMKEQLRVEKEKQSLDAKRLVLEERLEAIRKKNKQDEIARLEKIKGLQDKNYEEAYRDLLKNEAEIKRLDELKKKASSDELLRIEKERQARNKTYAEQKASLLKLEQERAKTEILNERLQSDKSKESDRQRKEAQKEADRLQKNAEKEARRLEREAKVAEDLANAYKQLEKNTRELKNESKKLGAEMYDLEKNGQKNTKAYRDLEKQYNATTKSALEGDKALKKLDQQVGDNFRSVGHYEKATRFLKNALAEMGLAFGAFEGVRYLIDSQVKLDSLSLSLKNVSDSSTEYGKNVEFLRGLAKDYGQDLISLTETYKNFIASTDNSNLSIEERRRIYESIIKAGSSLALSNDDVAGTLRGVQQMFSKGTVQAEELRQQLGDRLPGAFKTMAKSMGVTEEVLGDMMKKGLVLTDEVMPRFATVLEQDMGTNARARVNTLGGAFNNLKNEVLLYFNEAQSGYDINRSLADTLNFVANNLKEIISYVVSAIKIWASYKLVIASTQLANKMLGSSFIDLLRDGKFMSSGVSGLKDAFGGFANFLKTNVIGILVLMGTEFLAVNAKLKGIIGKISEYRQELKQSKEDVENNSKQEKLYLNAMFETLKKTNSESNRRKELIDEINSKYGTTIKNIKDEKEFTDQLNESYKEINKTIDEKIIRDKARIAYETTQNQLSEAKLATELSFQEFNAFFEQNATSQLTKRVLDIFGATGSVELKNIWKANQKVYFNIKKIADEAQKDYEKVLKKLGEEKGGGYKKPPTPPKDVPTSVQPLVDINTKLAEADVYLSRQVELLKDIQLLKQKIANIDDIDKQEKIIEAQRKLAETKGKYNQASVTNAVQSQKTSMEKESESIYNAKSQDAINKAKKDSDDEFLKLEQSRVKRQEEIDKKYAKYLYVLEVNKENGHKNLTKTAEQRVLDKNKKLSKDAKAFLDAQIELEKNYQEEIKKINLNKELRDKDAESDSEKAKLEHKERLKKIEVDANNKLTKEITENDKLVAEYRLNNIKKIAESTNSVIQKSLDYFIKLAERRIDVLDKRMERMSTQADFLRDKATAGSIQAQESLAQIDKQQMEAEKQKINEQRSIQRLQMAMTVFQAYSNNIQNAKIGENPFARTITDVSALSAFISSLPTFYGGTETDVASALGSPQLSGRDGHIIRVDGSEKILNPYLSQKTGDLTTFEIAKIAEDRLKGRLVYNSEGNTSADNMWASYKLINEIQDLKDIIKNKPESNIELGEIVGGVMHIIESKKIGNTKIRNISRFS